MHNYISFYLLSIGLIGLIYNRNNLIIYFLSMEILILSINILFLFISIQLEDLWGILIYFYILIVAASEISVGLSLLVSYYISYLDISVNYMKLLRW